MTSDEVQVSPQRLLKQREDAPRRSVVRQMRERLGEASNKFERQASPDLIFQEGKIRQQTLEFISLLIANQRQRRDHQPAVMFRRRK